MQIKNKISLHSCQNDKVTFQWKWGERTLIHCWWELMQPLWKTVCKFLNFLFIWRQSDRAGGVERVRGRKRSCICWFTPRIQVGPGQIQEPVTLCCSPTRWQGPNTWASFCCFPRSTIRELDQKQISGNLNHHSDATDEKMLALKEQFNLLDHNASPAGILET